MPSPGPQGMPAFGGYAASSFSIEPQAIPALRNSLMEIYHRVETFLRTKRHLLMMQPLGSDPASVETAKRHNANAKSALAAAQGYADQLMNVVHALDQQAERYHVTEAANTAGFQGGQ